MVPNKEFGLFLPTSWYGEEGYFSISTFSRLDLSLTGVGLRSSALDLVRDRGDFHVYAAPEVDFLGVVRPAGEITAFPTSPEGNLFGTIGALFFAESVLAFDPAGPYVALAGRPLDALDETFHRLAIVGDSGLPLTTDIRLAAAPDMEVTALISTSTRSYVSERVASHLPKRERKPGVRSTVELAQGAAVEVDFDVEEAGPTYAVPVGPDPIGMVIGLDVLRRFLTVFDFGSCHIGLREYPGAL